MAKSNWKGTSGWGAINDPTGVLNGRVLVASAGLTATNEDYLTTIVGTSTAFSANHYSVFLDYAFPNFDERHPMIAGKLGLIARASNFTGDPERSYNCYLGQLDVESKKVNIIRRSKNRETTLISADMPNSAISRGSKHTMEFRCFGTSQTTLQLLIDNSIVANIGDTTSSKHLTGIPGIQMRNGTAYCDTFSIMQYTEDGSTPSLWSPTQLGAGLTLSAWYIGSEGISATGTTIDTWADQSGNKNDLSANDASNQPQLLSNAVNNYNSVEFDGTNDFFVATDSDSLDMATDGLSIFKIINTKTFAGSDFSILNKGESYAFGSDLDNGYKFSNTSDSTTSSSFAGTTQIYQLVGMITDKDNTTGTGGLFVDGTLSAGVTFGTGADNANDLFIAKSGSNFFAGDIAEIVIIKGECNQENRQLVEGYLANKYATSDLLPSDHPYRNYAPIVQS